MNALHRRLVSILVSAALVHPSASGTIPDRLPPQDLPPALRALTPYSSDLPEVITDEEGVITEVRKFDAPMEVADDDARAAIKQVAQSTPEEFEKLRAEQRFTLISKILMFGHGKKLKTFTQDVMARLQVKGDNPNYEVRFTPALDPNAIILSGHAKMIIQAGLIAYATNADEYSYVIAHEMTHDNKEYMKAIEDDPEIQKVLEQVSGFGQLAPSQREEIRADIGAVARMIQAKMNPWGGYDMMRKLTEFQRKTDTRLVRFMRKIFSPHSMEYFRTHPAGEIRMAAMKAYIVKVSQEKDLADSLGNVNYFPKSLNVLRLRLATMAAPIMNEWFHRAFYAYVGYMTVDMAVMALFGTSIGDANLIAEIVSAGKGTLGSAAQTIWKPFAYLINNSDGVQKLVSLIGTGWDYFKTGLGYALSGLFMAMPVGLIYTIGNFTVSGYYQSKPYGHLQLLKITWAMLQIGQREDPLEKKQERLKSFVQAASLIETIYKQSNMVVSLQRVNKLLWFRMQMIPALSEFLQEIADDLRTGRTAWTAETIDRYFKQFPGYLWESPLIRKYAAEINQALKPSSPFLSETLADFDKADSPERLSPYDRVKIAKTLFLIGAKDTAYRLTGLMPDDLADFVLSKQHSDPELFHQFVLVINGLKNGERTFGMNARFRSSIQEAWLTSRRLKQVLASSEDRLVDHTFTQSVQYPAYKHFTTRYQLDQWIKDPTHKLDNEFKTVREFSAFVTEGVAARHADMTTLSPLLLKTLHRNPQWVENEADIESLLANDSFWPMLVGTKVEFTNLEELLAETIWDNMNKYPNVWRYEPRAAEKNHELILEALKRLGRLPTTTKERFALWAKLTRRGVTAATDKMFAEIYDAASPSERAEMERLALDEGRIWEPDIKVRITRNRLQSLPDYQHLITVPAGSARLEHVQRVIAFLEKALPERGRGLAEILEEISVKINSTQEESQALHAAKTGKLGGEKQEDLGLRVLSDILAEIIRWPKGDQWNFILYLKSEAEASARLTAAFPTIGPERVRRMYEVLPVAAQTMLLDTFLDAPTGLLGKIEMGRGWSKVIVDHLMKGKNADETSVATELLTGFLYALKATGNKPLQSYVISYLLALPKVDSKDAGQTLKNVLEVFGTTGVKIGQFLAASGLLPQYAEVLRSLQERAKIPLRQDVFKDFETVLETKDLPFVVLHLLGAASMKYAMLAREKTTGDNIVLKMMRLESIAHTRLEFKILEKMAEYLVKQNGTRYGIFRSIVNASRRAVERELVGKDEVQKSRIAARYMYVKLSDTKTKVSVPQELLLKGRLIAAEYAAGVSFFSLKPEFQPAIADKILSMEHDLLFKSGQPGDVIPFDPDRHAGNYRIEIKSYNGEEYIVLEPATVSPIDFGQTLKDFTVKDRAIVVRLFALSVIANKVGAADWIREEIAKSIPLTAKQKRLLGRGLRLYFPNKGLQAHTAYFGILSALELAGVEININYFDFVRSIIQLKQYEPFASQGRSYSTPSETFERLVREQVETLRPQVNLSWRDKLSYLWNNPAEVRAWIKTKTGWNKGDAKVLPQPGRPSEDTVTCQSLLE